MEMEGSISSGMPGRTAGSLDAQAEHALRKIPEATPKEGDSVTQGGRDGFLLGWELVALPVWGYWARC